MESNYQRKKRQRQNTKENNLNGLFSKDTKSGTSETGSDGEPRQSSTTGTAFNSHSPGGHTDDEKNKKKGAKFEYMWKTNFTTPVVIVDDNETEQQVGGEPDLDT